MQLFKNYPKENEFDGLCFFIKEVSSLIDGLFTNSNFQTTLSTHSLTQTVRCYLDTNYKYFINLYKEKIESFMRRERIQYYLVKETPFKKVFEENRYSFVGLSIHLSYINKISEELISLTKGKTIDVTDRSQLNLLIVITGLILFLCSITQYIMPDVILMSELMENLQAALSDIRATLA